MPRILPWAALLALALLAWLWQPLTSNAVTAAADGARVACPCRFIAGRELADCRRDLEGGIGLVVLSEDAEAKSVTVWIPLLASQTATFREGQGCLLEPWQG
jgi:hypothetical protein